MIARAKPSIPTSRERIAQKLQFIVRVPEVPGGSRLLLACANNSDPRALPHAPNSTTQANAETAWGGLVSQDHPLERGGTATSVARLTEAPSEVQLAFGITRARRGTTASAIQG